ncbi:MAG TPA: hypothetical protein VM165_23530 [Planctomycetaceae bacterium]|nr:hypothetical protein [Planctomycetaceae bacterium]
MPELIYVREIHDHSFLVFTTSGEGFRLRDFSAEKGPAVVIAKQAEGRMASDIREMAIQCGKPMIPVAERSMGDYPYWHEQTANYNARYLMPHEAMPLVSVTLPSGVRTHVEAVVVKVIAAVLTAAILLWLGLSK